MTVSCTKTNKLRGFFQDLCAVECQGLVAIKNKATAGQGGLFCFCLLRVKLKAEA